MHPVHVPSTCSDCGGVSGDDHQPLRRTSPGPRQNAVISVVLCVAGWLSGSSVYTELQVGCHRKRSSISHMRIHCHSKLMGFNAHV